MNPLPPGTRVTIVFDGQPREAGEVWWRVVDHQPQHYLITVETPGETDEGSDRHTFTVGPHAVKVVAPAPKFEVGDLVYRKNDSEPLTVCRLRRDNEKWSCEVMKTKWVMPVWLPEDALRDRVEPRGRLKAILRENPLCL